MDKVTVKTIQKRKESKEPITALTCYDAATAKIVDQCGLDVALVGDSLANTRLGYKNTLPVTFEEMLHHVKASARGVQRALLVADMPYLSYETDPREAAKLAGRFIKEGGAEAVKLEGGSRIAGSLRAILNANVPVMGHLGLTPQSVNKIGGFKVQGRKRTDAAHIIMDAKFLEKLGVFSIVLEGIPADLARKITKMLKIPTIGIGAGPDCDGQILVFDDLVGFSSPPLPKFVKRYANLKPQIVQALTQYRYEVITRRFPEKGHSY